MKKPKYSFLYLLVILCFIGVTYGYSQTSNDSLRHYYYLATNPKTSTDLPLAYNFYKAHKEYSLQEKDTINAVQALRFMASIQKHLGYLYDSEVSAIEALKLLDNLKVDNTNIEAKLGLYNHLGILYELSNNCERAHQFYDDALKIAKTQKDSITIINNKANLYIDQEQYKLAIKLLSQAYTNSLGNGNKAETARVLENLGIVQSKLNISKALSNMKEALNIRLQINDVKGIYASYRDLSQYYHDNKNPEKAKLYADKAYKLAKQINSTSYIEDALSNLVALDTDTIITAYKQLKDSVFKAKELSRNAYAFNKYNYEKKEKELANIQFKREREKIMYTSLGIILFIITLFTAYIVRQRHKKEKLKEVYATEIRISQKVHDELANDVYHVMNNIQNSAQETDVLNQLENIYERTRDISYENAHIDLNNYALELKEMLNAYQNTSTTITAIGLNKTLFEDMKNHKRIAIARVLKELMTNMKKHSNASNVVISFKRVKKKMVITYTDDGVGFKKTGHFKSNGLQNAENRIKNINGSFNFDTNRTKGTAINIAFPV